MRVEKFILENIQTIHHLRTRNTGIFSFLDHTGFIFRRIILRGPLEIGARVHQEDARRLRWRAHGLSWVLYSSGSIPHQTIPLSTHILFWMLRFCFFFGFFWFPSFLHLASLGGFDVEPTSRNRGTPYPNTSSRRCGRGIPALGDVSGSRRSISCRERMMG